MQVKPTPNRGLTFILCNYELNSYVRLSLSINDIKSIFINYVK